MKAMPLAKGAGCMPRGVGEIRTLFDYDKPMCALSFRTVNDTVQGGGSSCEIKYLPKLKCSQFFGRLNYIRGGGWASVRSAKLTGKEMVGTHGLLLLSSSTDGNEYKIVVKTRPCKNTMGSIWHADFMPSKDVGGCWRVVTLPWSNFSPILKGYPHDAGGPLHPEAVEELGLMISRTSQDGSANIHIKEGEFCLRIKWIRGYFASLQQTASPLLVPPQSPLKSPTYDALANTIASLDFGQDEQDEEDES